jgi:hypothetical protein
VKRVVLVNAPDELLVANITHQQSTARQVAEVST